MALLIPPDPPLADGTVLLRPSTPEDLPAIEAGIRDPDVIRWIGPTRESAAELAALNARRWSDGSPTLSICDMTGRCVGLIWINAPDRDRPVASVGYWLLPGARGRGLATAAVRLVARWATRGLGLRPLRLTTEPGNERSRRVAERSGFRQSAILRGSATISGRVIDQVVYEFVDGADRDPNPSQG